MTARSYGHEVRFNRAMFGPKLEQPIPFSHRLHVTDKEIDCFYCHPYGERSLNTGLPTVAKCLACHDHIIPEHREIKKLRSYKERGVHLPWKRVYYNPDHVFFPHFRHLAQDIECQQCHGEVQEMEVLNSRDPAWGGDNMGWCVDCHRDPDPELGVEPASTDCAVCHY